MMLFACIAVVTGCGIAYTVACYTVTDEDMEGY